MEDASENMTNASSFQVGSCNRV